MKDMLDTASAAGVDLLEIVETLYDLNGILGAYPDDDGYDEHVETDDNSCYQWGVDLPKRYRQTM